MSAPVADDPDRCPRCGGRFTCGAAGPAPCGCFGLKIDSEVLADLRERYAGCLCLACLRELMDTPTAGQSSGPA